MVVKITPFNIVTIGACSTSSGALLLSWQPYLNIITTDIILEINVSDIGIFTGLLLELLSAFK